MQYNVSATAQLYNTVSRYNKNDIKSICGASLMIIELGYLRLEAKRAITLFEIAVYLRNKRK